MTSSPQRLETVRRIQYAMATAYTTMGAWCLFHPSSVITLSLAAPFALHNRTTHLLMRCFGAQAATSGLLLGVSEPTEQKFTMFALAMIPYFGFNAWFLAGPGRDVFTSWLWLDVVGNAMFFSGSLLAAKLLREERGTKKSS